MYTYKLKIEGNQRKLSNEDGLNLKDLTNLLSKLIKCLGSNAYLFTLSDIENSSYTPTLKTPVEEGIDLLDEIHEAVAKNEIENLSTDYKNYALELNKVLFERGLHITLINSRDEKIIKLSGLTKDSTKGYYYNLTSVTGKVISLYGKVELNPHILVRTGNGFEYSIYVNQDQEIKLGGFYKNTTIRFRIRSKIDGVTGKAIQSNLIDFTPLNSSNFYSAIQNIKSEYGDIFKNIEDSAKLLQNLRNS
jgi:hypothetical protein